VSSQFNHAGDPDVKHRAADYAEEKAVFAREVKCRFPVGAELWA
jgi:hypothetical protein